MVHAIGAPVIRKRKSKGDQSAISASNSGSTSSSYASASGSASTSGKAAPRKASGWVLQVAGGGPSIYHTGGTGELAEMAMIDQLYNPTHVIMPLGEACDLSPQQAALALHEHLPRAHPLIPMILK